MGESFYVKCTFLEEGCAKVYNLTEKQTILILILYSAKGTEPINCKYKVNKISVASK